MAHLLGIRPWEIGQLTVAEFRSCVAWVTAYNKREDD